MAKMIICSVYDRVLDSFSTSVQVYANAAAAVRDARQVVLDEQTQFARNAVDYSLWHLADFDSDNGVIVGIERSKIIEFDALKSEK